MEQNLGPGTVTTVYTYDAANQLDTAEQGSTTWQYTYDANGSLVSDGVKTYTYDSANRLVQVNNQTVVTSLSYNGLGQRLSMDAAGVIAHYVMDGNSPLTAETSGNNTYYLYGLGAIGEKTTAWNFSLPDGTNTPRQLSNGSGEITLSARYTPWGDTLELNGTGNFAFGYFGGVMDAATGLIYVGNGQYYDPETGRFLTRDARPNQTNPYVPLNPIGAILAPVAMLSMFYMRKRKRSKWDIFIIIMLLGITAGFSMVACGPTPPVTPAPQSTEVPGSNNTETPTVPPSTQTLPPTQTQPPTQTSTPTPAIGTPGIPAQCSPNVTPVPGSYIEWQAGDSKYNGEFKLTYYHYAMEDDPAYATSPYSHLVWVKGNYHGSLAGDLYLPLQHRYNFVFNIKEPYAKGVAFQGTGITSSATGYKYISIDYDFNNSHYGANSDWIHKVDVDNFFYIYQPGGAFKDSTPWKTVATRDLDRFPPGATIIIEKYTCLGEFTVTDTGTKLADKNHFDIFVGPMYWVDVSALGNNNPTSRVGILRH